MIAFILTPKQTMSVSKKPTLKTDFQGTSLCPIYKEANFNFEGLQHISRLKN